MNSRLIFTTLAMVAMVLLGGCKKDNYQELDSVCPLVVSTSPFNGETSVPLVKTITATFNEKMNPATITTASFSVLGGGVALPGTVSYQGQTASFKPNTLLANNTTYIGKVTTAVKDLMGNALQINYVWTFSTGANVRPIVIATDPVNQATGVVLNKIVSATFNVNMDPASFVGNTFTLTTGGNAVAGTVTVSDTNVFFTPTNFLIADSTYTATITTNAKSVDGISMSSNYSWTFSTGSTLAPFVISTVPADNATGVPQAQVLSATFSEPMNPATLNGGTFLLRQGTTLIPGTVAYSGVTATFTPSTNLLSNTVYTATVTTGAQNLTGVGLANNYVWTFTTLVLPGPTVISTIPTNNALGVPVNQVVSATFSEPMDMLTLNGTTFTLQQGSNPVAGNVTSTSTTASFTPATNLLSGTTYTATITTGAKNVGGLPLANNYVWNFTTVVLPPPVVTSTDPFNLETNVPLNKIVSATFSVPMNPSTINSTTFTLKLGNTPVPGSITYNGSTAFFTPNSSLQSDTTYTATITTGAQNPSGVSLVSDYVWTFNMVPHLGPPPVDLNSALRFGILAGVGVSNMAGFSEIRNLDVGIYPGVRSSIVGFPRAIVVNGAIYASDDIAPPGVAAMLLQAKNDLTGAYLFAEGATNPAPTTVSGDLGGLTLAPGIYKTTSSLLIQSGDLTLDAQGDVNATWIFQIGSGFTTVGGAGGSVILAGGANANNVFWQTGSSATVGDYTDFQGNILALTSITMNAYATATGRMLARNGAVVMTSTNIISKP